MFISELGVKLLEMIAIAEEMWVIFANSLWVLPIEIVAREKVTTTHSVFISYILHDMVLLSLNYIYNGHICILIDFGESCLTLLSTSIVKRSIKPIEIHVNFRDISLIRSGIWRSIRNFMRTEASQSA